MTITIVIPDADLKAAFFDPTTSVAARDLILGAQNLRLLLALNSKLDTIFNQGVNIMATMAQLKESVDAAVSGEEKALALITGFSAQLADVIANGGDPVALQTMKDELDAESAKLAAAVAAASPPA